MEPRMDDAQKLELAFKAIAASLLCKRPASTAASSIIDGAG